MSQEDSRSVALPSELTDILLTVLTTIAEGGTVTIGSMPRELTTTQAAKQLGVSRPTLMRMIHDGQMPARLVGSHHRIKTTDLLAAKRARLERQRQAFEELRVLEDELDQEP